MRPRKDTLKYDLKNPGFLFCGWHPADHYEIAEFGFGLFAHRLVESDRTALGVDIRAYEPSAGGRQHILRAYAQQVVPRLPDASLDVLHLDFFLNELGRQEADTFLSSLSRVLSGPMIVHETKYNNSVTRALLANNGYDIQENVEITREDADLQTLEDYILAQDYMRSGGNTKPPSPAFQLRKGLALTYGAQRRKVPYGFRVMRTIASYL